jgi:hypothetical protein
MKSITSSLIVALASTPLFAAPPAVKLTLTPSTDGLTVSYELAQPVTTFRFEIGAPPALRANWRAEGVFFSADGRSVEAADAAAFSRFSVFLPADKAEVDRMYPALSRVGAAGWVLYLPYLRPATNSGEVAVAPALAADQTALAAGSATVRPDSRYVFVGPTSYVSGKNVRIIADPASPGWLVANVRADAELAIITYARRLGVPIRGRPIIAINHTAEPAANGIQWHGDTTDNLAFLRFYGPEWQTNDLARAASAREFVYHEMFHLWNGGLTKPAADQNHPWLHEGAAEFASWRALRDLDLMTPDDFNANVGEALSRCRALLEADPLLGPLGKSGGAPYYCGAVVQWVSDLGAARAAQAPKDFFAIWGRIFKAAAKKQNTYTLEDWQAMVAEPSLPADASELIASIVNREGLTRWARMPERLRLLGVNLSTYPADANEVRRRFLMHLLSQSCTAPFGYYSQERNVKLDTGRRCGTLPVDPEVDSAEELNFFTNDPLSAYEMIAGRCSRNEDVTLANSATGLKIKLPCRKPMPKLPEQYRVR